MSGSSKSAGALRILGGLYVAAGAVLSLWLLASPAGAGESVAGRKALGVIAVLLVGWGVVTLRERRAWVVHGNLLLVTVLVVGPIFLEVFFRSAIALGVKPFRQPQLYADAYADDEYWQMYYTWVDDKEAVKPSWAQRDPMLGWTATEGNPGRVLGASTAAAGGYASTITFYGDSFTHWLFRGQSRKILTQRLPDYELRNLAVPGYGLDQMVLRFRSELADASGTTAVFGILTEDIDRMVMTVRHGPKPYFVVEGDQLVVRGVPIIERPQEWVERHPPQTKSYVLALVKRMYWLVGAGGNLRESYYRREEKQVLARRLLAEVVQSGRARQMRLLFVIFYLPDELRGTGWREVFLKQQLSQLQVPYLDTMPVLLRAARREEREVHAYYQTDGHLDDRGNQVVAEALADYLRRQLLTGDR